MNQTGIFPHTVSRSSSKAPPNRQRKTLTEIDAELFEDLKFYFQYASSAYTLDCPHPNGNVLVARISPESSPTQGFIARDGYRKEFVVALRGSSTIQNCVTDGQIALVPLVSPGVVSSPDVRVHSGFLRAWNEVAEEVVQILQAELLTYPDYTLATTGHSLGGALSSLAALTLKQRFPERDTRMYTYGQPRTGNTEYARLINDTFGPRAFRVVHGEDGVPTMIPTLLGYHHHGIEYWQYSEPSLPLTIRECSAGGEDLTCSRIIPSMGVNPAHMIYFDIPVTTPFCR